MNYIKHITGKKTYRGSLVLAALLFSFACSHANATGIPVVDVALNAQTKLDNYIQFTKQKLQYAQQVEQYKKQIDQYKQQIMQYQQMLVKGMSYKGKPGYRAGASDFATRDIDEGIDEACLKPKRSTSVSDVQHQYCRAIVQTQNRRYNAMVAVLKDVSQRDKELQQARDERAGIDAADLGMLQSNTNLIASIETQIQNDMQNGKALLDAYDAMLASLNDNMVRSANEGLENKKKGLLGGPGGTLVQGAILKGALQVARARDR